MSLKIKSFRSENYYYSKWQGDPAFVEVINSYTEFFESGDWVPGMNELGDVSECSFESFSSTDLRNLAKFMESVYKAHNLDNVITAVYCPKPIHLGMANAYSSWADESPETIKIFWDLNEAKDWLIKQGKKCR